MRNNADDKLKDYLKTLVTEDNVKVGKRKKVPWYKKLLPKKRR